MIVEHAYPWEQDYAARLADSYNKQVDEGAITPSHYTTVDPQIIRELSYGLILVKGRGSRYVGLQMYSLYEPTNLGDIYEAIQSTTHHDFGIRGLLDQADQELTFQSFSQANIFHAFQYGGLLAYGAHLEAFPRNEGVGRFMVNYFLEQQHPNFSGAFWRCKPTLVGYFSRFGAIDSGIAYQRCSEQGLANDPLIVFVRTAPQS